MKTRIFPLICRRALLPVILALALPATRATAQPVITNEPMSQTVDAGSTVSFTVGVTGTPPLTYHWRQNGLPINGSAATLTLLNVSDNQAGSYTVVVQNGSGSVTSSPPAILTVLDPPVIATEPVNAVVTNGDEAIFSVGVNGANLSYQWLSNNVPILGETNDVLDIFPVQDADAASYSVTITNTDGNASSTTALLTVVDQQLTTSGPITPSVYTCTNLTFTVVAHGTDLPLFYQWYKDGNPVGTSSTYSVLGVQFADAGAYTVVVSDGQGASASTMAVIAVTDPPPVVLTQNITINLDASGNASIIPSQVDNGSYDNCGILSESVTPNTFNCANVGSNVVTLSVTDTSNQVSTNIAIVTVQDVTPPTPVINTITVQLDNTGNYPLTPADVTNITSGSSDACGIASTSVIPSAFTYCDPPSKTVTVILTDVNGNSVTNAGTINILAPVGPPPVTYVDTNYIAGPCPGVTFPFNGGSGTYYIGYNAFSTIQAGLNAVASGGVVNVAPGTYTESPNITRPVTLASIGGINAANTIITLQQNSPPTYLSALTIGASDVSVEGFTVVGYDAVGPGGQAGTDIILQALGITNIDIGHNVILVGNIGPGSDGDDGMGVETTYNTVPPFVENLVLHDNTFQPVDAGGMASRAYYINPGTIHFSFISNSIAGNFTSDSISQAENALVAGNTVVGTGTSLAFGNWGYPDATIWGHSIYSNNLVTNAISAINLYDSEDVTIENNMLGGNGEAVLLEDYALTVDVTSDQIVNNSMSNCITAGVDNESTIGTPDAVSNWWGDVSGPYSLTLNPYGVGSPVINNATVAPWLASGVNAISGPGFVPAPGVNYPPVQLVFAIEPQGANLGSLLSVQPVVQIEDTNGNVTPWANPAVANALGNDTTGAVLAGTNPQLAANGVATFTDLSVTVSGGSNLTLVASAPYLTSATSAAFNITNPAPVISSISPFFVRAGGGDVTLTVIGTGFVWDSVVYFNGNPLATVYVSSTQLTATIPSADIANIGTANITVTSPGPGGGLTAQLPFSIDVATPPIVYVDHNYTGLAANTTVDWPYDFNTGPHIIGYDAFATIQGGVSAVASNGTVYVAAGTYVEDVTISNAMKVLGPNATNNPNTQARVPEAIIEPATAGADVDNNEDEIVVYITTNHVTIKGFTVDGHNPGLVGGILVNGVDVAAAEGIVSYEGVGSISIVNNIIKDTSYTGVDFYNYYNGGTATADNYIACNLFDNLGAEGWGIGAVIYNNFYADVTKNVMTNLVVGVQTGNFDLANPGTTQSIDNNSISANAVGIFFNLMYDQTSTFSVSNNAISFAYAPGSTVWDGMLIGSIQSATSVNFVSNQITGTTTNEATVGYPTAGYNIWNTPTSGQVLIAGGSVSNANYGVWVNDYAGYESQAATTTATIAGVNIAGSSLAGVYVQDDPLAAPNTPVQATVTGNTVIAGCAVGVLVQGTNAGASVLNNLASITGNGVGVSVDTGAALLEGNDLTGNSVAGISLTNNAIVDAGDCSGGNVTHLGTGSGANGSSAGGNILSGYGFDNAAPWAIENFNGASTPAVLAEHDIYGAGVSDSIAAAFLDPFHAIYYSQASLLAAAPGPLTEECTNQAPAAVDLPSFLALGGLVTASSPSVTVSANDVPPLAPQHTTVRTYTISDGCTTTTCQQTIIINEVTPPTIGSCPASFVSPGPTVNYTLPAATDDCGSNTVIVTGNPPPGSVLTNGVYTVVCTAVNNAGLTSSCSFQVVVPNTSLTDAYVDASYGSLPPGTSVAWPNNGGAGPHSIGYDAFATIQGGINAVAAGGTVHVAAGTYPENVAANKPVVLQGANVGVAGCGARGPESIINGGAGAAISVQSDGVTVDGFALQGAIGLLDIGFQGLVVQNNAVTVAAAGLEAQNVSPTPLAGVTLQSNCITLTGQLAGGSPTAGIGIAGVGGTAAPVVSGNSISGAYYGYLLYGLNAPQPTAIAGGSISGVMQGVAVFNLSPLTLTNFAASQFAVNGVTMSGFAEGGNYSSMSQLANVDFQAGVYVFTGGNNLATAITGLVSNVTVSGTTKVSSDSSGLYFTDFSTAAGTMQNITVQQSTVQNNGNRGIFISGAHAVVNVTQSSVLGNGSDPFVTGGNPGFGIIARNNAQANVTQCFIANPSIQTNDQVYAISANANTGPQGPTFTVSNCSVVNNGNGFLAQQSAGTLNASGNWWGTTSPGAIAGLMTGQVDFNPYLDSGADTDAVTPGFQGDFSVLHVTPLGAQTGIVGRIQEGINDVVGGTVIIEAGLYVENVLANKANLELAGVGQGAVTIIPALSSPNPCPGGGSLCGGESDIILVRASSVTIHDVTLDGHNPAFTSGYVSGGVDLDARNGIIEDYNSGIFNNTVVSNVTVQNIYLRGIYASSGGTGFFFHDDTVMNVQDDPSSVAMFNFGGSGIMSNNAVSAAADALSANWSTGTAFLNNTITASGSGVHSDNSSGPDVLAGNNVSAMQADAYGVWVFVPYGNIVISNNLISSCAVGLGSFGQGAPVTPLFVNNQVTSGAGAGNVGIYESTSIFSYGFTPVSSAFQGNTIQNTAYGIYLDGENGSNLSVTITANNAVTGNQYGLYASGSPVNARIENTDLRSNTVAAITATGGATVDAGNCGPDVTGLGDSVGGNLLTGYLTGGAQAAVNSNAGGTPALYAYNDSFGATALQPEISSALTGNVLASQGGGLLATPPTQVSVQCPSLVPAPANTLAAFSAAGGVVSATAVSVNSTDSTVIPGPYDGTVTRTYTLADACGQNTTVQQSIIVQDTTPPMITQCAPDQSIDADATGHASLPDLTSNVLATDNCASPVTVTQSPLPGTVVGLGVTTVTLTAVDASGNLSTPCMANVTVLDVTPPTLACAPDVTISILQAKDPYVTGTPTATDAGGPVALTYSDDASGLTNCDSTGTLLRTWTATDPSSNSTNCLQTITVVDTNAPFFTFVPTNITTTNDLGQCSAVVDYAGPRAADLGYFEGFEDPNFVSSLADLSWDWNDYPSHVARVPSGTDGINASSGAAYAIIDSTVPGTGPGVGGTGAYTLLGGGNAPYGTGYRVALDVYINLNDPAVVSATPANGYGWDLSTASQTQAGNYGRDYIFHVAAYSSNGVVVAADNNSADAASGRQSNLTNYSNYATLTNSGWYTFEWFFRNTNGVLAVDLKVRDTNRTGLFSQTLSDQSDTIANTSGNPYYTWFTFLAVNQLPIDNTVFERNVPVVASEPSGFAFPVGSNVLTFVAADTCNNSLTNTNFSITVNDVEAPSANVPANIVQANDPGQCGAIVNFTLPAQTDNCGVASTIATPASGSFFAVGTTNVTVVVTDIHGNSATNSFTVTVNDTEPPSANVPGDIVQNNDPSLCGAVVNFTLPAQTDNCGVASTNATPASGSFFPVGTTPVTVVVTDIHGNSATNTFNVTVNDTEPPVAICPPNIVQGVDPGQNFATVNFTIPTATDNCGVVTTIATAPSGSQFGVGTNVVTVVATDIHGNTNVCTFTVAVIPLPTVVSQPVSVTNNAGTTALFSVVATNPAPLSYQWLKNGSPLGNGGNISGATNATLMLANVQDADVASYSVVVTDLAGSVTSSNATLTVIDPPVITTQPLSQTNNATTTAAFTVVSSGTTPFTYQWYKNGPNALADGGNISGATNSTLTISNVLAADQGTYTVTVSNPAGTATSSNAVLTVIDPYITVQPVNVTNNLGGPASFSVTAVGTTPLAYQWQQDDLDIPGATTSTYSIASIQDSDAGSYTVVVTNTVGTATSATAVLTVKHPPVIVHQPADLTVNLGQQAIFSVSANGATPFSYQWLMNNNPIGGATNFEYVIGAATAGDAGTYTVFITNSDGSILSSGAVLMVITPPSITNQPASLTNNAGTTASFTVGLAGSPAVLTWYKNATMLLTNFGNVSGADSNVLTLSNVLGADAGSYTMIASNNAGVVTTMVATLTVIDPVIIAGPTNLTNIAGTSATFSVSAYGTAPSYQWLKNGAIIPGATGTNYTIPAVADPDQAGYSVVVSNSFGVVTSAPPATLTVLDPVVITSEPGNQTVGAGTNASFTVVATGTSPSFQWYDGATPLSDIVGKIQGSQTASLTVFSAQDADAGSYSVTVTNTISSTNSTPAVLTVIDAPVISTEPTNVTNNAGTTASFTVGLTGSPAVLSWYKNAVNLLINGGNISGATSNVLTLSNVLGADAGSYTMVASNLAGVATTMVATLTVIDPVIIAGPTNLTNIAGTSATFSVSAYGTAPTYQWLKNGTNIPGATGTNYTIPAVADADQGSYSVVVSNTFGVITSTPPATLTVLDPVVITSEPANQTVGAGTNATFTVAASGTSPSFQWYDGATPLSDIVGKIQGSQTASLIIFSAQNSDAGSYSVTVTNTISSTNSTPAVLTVIDAPVITGQPTSITNPATTTASFNVTNIGSPATYQWSLNGNALHNGGEISGADTASLTISNLLAADDGSYTVTIQNLAGTVVSSNALLVVLDPYITAQPQSTTNRVGTTANFSVTAVGTQPLGYQWYFDGFLLIDETNSTLTLDDVANSDEGSYTVVVTNTAGSVTSAPAMLVTFPPLIVTQPVGGFVFPGEPFSFSVGVNGQTPFAYQWQFNGSNIPGATQRIFTIPSTVLTNTGEYSVLVSNPQGAEDSENALLLVTDQPVLQIINYSSQTATVEVSWFNGSNAVLQASQDLTNWTPVYTNTTPYTVVDTNSPGFTNRFYRALGAP